MASQFDAEDTLYIGNLPSVIFDQKIDFKLLFTDRKESTVEDFVCQYFPSHIFNTKDEYWNKYMAVLFRLVDEETYLEIPAIIRKYLHHNPYKLSLTEFYRGDLWRSPKKGAKFYLFCVFFAKTKNTPLAKTKYTGYARNVIYDVIFMYNSQSDNSCC